MNLVDLAVLVVLVLGVVAGARAGFLGPVLGLVGAAIGFGLALLASTVLRDVLASIEQPARAIVTLAGLAAFVLIGEAIGGAVGASVSLGLRRGGLRPLDALGGAMVGVAHVIGLVWLVSGMIAAGMASTLTATARDSVALRVVGERLPPPASVAGRLLTLLDTTDLPPLFAGLEPRPAPPVSLPADAEARALAESALASTARVTSTGCAVGSTSVGSGFFVSATHAVTNAHVVAGSSATTVTLGGSVYSATLVAFDSDADLAMLHVAEARAPALVLASVAPPRGTSAVALGFPGGGELTVTPAAVTAAYEVPGPNIYGEGTNQRSVVELTAAIQRGNSGGPLVTAPGVAGGVIFGASGTAPEVGYAIGADEAAERIGPFIGSTREVDSGACL